MIWQAGDWLVTEKRDQRIFLSNKADPLLKIKLFAQKRLERGEINFLVICFCGYKLWRNS